MKLAIVGSRTFCDYQMMVDYISYITQAEHLAAITLIISGGARGADDLAVHYAREHSIPYTLILPEWDRYGRSAGIIRNRLIIDSCDVCIAFWDQQSRGTEFDIRYCSQIGRPCYVCLFTPAQ